jgi:hypothetical protein
MSNKKEIVVSDNGVFVKSGIIMNDSVAPSSFNVWSSSMVDKKADKSKVLQKDNLTILDINGQYKDSGIKIDDSIDNRSSFVLWTSNKVASLDKKGKEGNLLKLNGDGQYVDSGLFLQDNAVSASGLWSSSKISEFYDMTCFENNVKQDVLKDDSLKFDTLLFQNGNVASSNLIYPGKCKMSGEIVFTGDAVFGFFLNGVLHPQSTKIFYSGGHFVGFLDVDSESIFEIKVLSGSASVLYGWLLFER